MARTRLPRCSVCKKGGEVHVVSLEPGNPETGHTYLCASCELLAERPDAKLGQMPTLDTITKKRLPLQRERLFDV